MATQETNCTYKNPKRPAYHEAGHLVALYLLTGSLSEIRSPGANCKSDKMHEHSQIFKEVCFWIAGGVAERVHCHLKALPVNTTMVEDLDMLLTYSKHEWQLPFKQSRKGYPVCPALDSMIHTAEYVITSQFRSYETILLVRSVTEYLLTNSPVNPDALADLQNDARIKRELLRIFKTSTLTNTN